MQRWLFRLSLGLSTILFATARAQACAVCQGDPDSPLVKGAEAGVLFMVILTYFVLLGMVALPIVWTVRSRQIRLRNEASEQPRADDKPTSTDD